MTSTSSLAWLPNALTLIRCALAFVVGWLIFSTGGETIWPFVAFVLVAATDFADGYLARRLNAVSKFGAFLDPIADKLLVGISLAAISLYHGGACIFVIPTIAIILRDFTATALRLVPGIDLPVSQLAKWKTTAEMVGIGGLLLAFALGSLALTYLSIAIVWFAAFLAIYTLGLYIGSLFANQNDRAKK